MFNQNLKISLRKEYCLTAIERKVLALVKLIPTGKVTTYQILAKKLGNKALARLVGNTLAKNPWLITIPCHRVVKSDGTIGHYQLGLAKKTSLLHNEGVIIKGGKVANFVSHLYQFH